MNEQKKVTLPGSISNIPTTNYGRAYSIMSTWAGHYTADEMKRVLIGRGIDIRDIDVEAMHRICREGMAELNQIAGTVEVTYEDGTKESRSASASMMQPKTPEEQENGWNERKRGLIVAALARHSDNPAKLVEIEKLTERLFGRDRTFSERGKDMTELASLLGVNTLNEDPAWEAFKSQSLESVLGMHRSPAPIKWSGESELARISDYESPRHGFLNPWNLKEKDTPSDSRFSITPRGQADEIDLDVLKVGKPHTFHMSNPAMGDIFGIPKPAPMRERLSHPFDHIFHNYTPEYLREQAMARKAKRIKNQRRRRNAKARRK